MVQKKSLYIIESISDEPVETVRKGSTVRLSDGTNEWVLLENWSSGVIEDVDKYSISDKTAIYQTDLDLGSGKAINITIDDDSTTTLFVEIYSTRYNPFSVDGEYIYLAAIGLTSKNVILSNGVIHSEYSGGVLKITNTSNADSETAIKISALSINSSFRFNEITVSDQYTDATSIADEGINDEISALQTKTTTNTTNIATNATGVAENAASASQNSYNISQNAAAISNSNTNIATNVSDIATNVSNISANTTAIATINSGVSGSLTANSSSGATVDRSSVRQLGSIITVTGAVTLSTTIADTIICTLPSSVSVVNYDVDFLAGNASSEGEEIITLYIDAATRNIKLRESGNTPNSYSFCVTYINYSIL